MAETTLNLNALDSESRESRTHVILTANSASAIPDGEYIYFKAVFTDSKGTVICKRTITDNEGNAVKLTAIDQMVVLDYNFITIEPVYYGSSMPSDLKVYQF